VYIKSLIYMVYKKTGPKDYAIFFQKLCAAITENFAYYIPLHMCSCFNIHKNDEIMLF